MKKLLYFLLGSIFFAGVAYAGTTILPVGQGGTGQSSFGQGWLGINNSGAFLSSTSPTVNYLTATSTATSSFQGGINLSGTDCFATQGTCLQTYVQNATAYKQAVNYATAAVLPGTPSYANGSSGVGATLTEVGFGALVVDGQTVTLGQRILVKDQADQTQNGIYTVTTVGSGIASYLLTRSTDYNTPNDIYSGTTIPVLAGGTANADTQWSETTTGTITIGSSNIAFEESSVGTNAVPTSRNVNTTLPLTGGGALSADLTLATLFTTTTNTGIGNNKFLYTTNGGVLVGAASSSFFGYTPLNPTRTINTTFPIAGGGDLSADRTLTFGGLTTSTAAVTGNIPYFSGVNTFANVATGTISGSGGVTATAAQSIIGSGLTIGCTAASGSATGCLGSTDWLTFNGKVATGTTFASGNLATWGSNGTLYNTATSTLTASSPLTGSFTQIGSGGSLGCTTATGAAAGCLSSADWLTFNGKIATGTTFSSGNLLYWGSAGTVFNAATSSETCTYPVVCGAHNVLAGGGAITFNGLSTSSPFSNNQIVYTSNTGTLVTAASSTLFGVGTPGYVWSYQNGSAGWFATSTGGGSGTVTSITLGSGLDGATPITTSGTITAQVSTSSVPTIGNLSYWTGAGTPSSLGTVATGTITGTGGVTATAGQSVIGSGLTVGCTAAGSGATGCLSSTDWNTFNNKPPYPFTPTTNYNVTMSATSTAIWAKAGLAASSTSYFDQIVVGTSTTGNTFATSTFANAVEIGTTTQATGGSSSAMLTLSNISSAIGALLINTWTNVTNAFTIKNSSGTTVFNVDTTSSNPFFGIGTSTPWGSISIVGDASDPLFAVASSSNQGLPNFEIDKVGHIITSGPKPVATICGTSPSITGNDTAGRVTTGTVAPLSCTVTFNIAYAAAPACVVTGGPPTSAVKGNALISSTTSTGFSFMSAATTTVFTTGMTSWVASYICYATQ